MVRVLAAQVVDVQGDEGVVGEALEELVRQLGVEAADHAGLERHVHGQARPAGEIDHHARQRLVERHVGVAVARQAALVADRLADRHAEGDADVLDGVVAVDVQVALGLDVEVDQCRGGRSARACGRRSRCRWRACALPLPSRSTLTRICVSLVLRWMLARRGADGAVAAVGNGQGRGHRRLARRAAIISVFSSGVPTVRRRQFGEQRMHGRRRS